jgi:TP901 family phage tail tape measure protein
MSSVKNISIAIAGQFEKSFDSAFATADERIGALADRMKRLNSQSASMKGLEDLRSETQTLSKAMETAENSVKQYQDALDAAKAKQKDAADKGSQLTREVAKQNKAYQDAKNAHKALEDQVIATGSATKEQNRAIQQAWKEVKRQKSGYDDARKALQDHTRETKANEKALRQNDDSIEHHKQRLKEAQGTLDVAKAAFNSNTSAIKAHETALAKDGRNVADLTGEHKKLAKELSNVSRNFETQSRSNKWKERQKELRGEIAATGLEVAAFGYALSKPITIAAEFEHSMAKVGAQTMANADEMKKLEVAARALGDKTIFSSSQAASAESYLAQAGFQVQEILDSLEGVLNLAAAGETDLAETAEMASNMLAGFNLDATETIRVADTMTATFISSNTDLRQLAETMKYVAPIASALGASIEEVSAEAGLLGNVGLQGSMAGTALRAMYNRLSAPPAGAEDALERLKIKTMDANKNLRPMPEILKEIDKAMTHLGSAEKAEIIKKIFGEEAAAGATELIKKAGSGSLEFEIQKLELAPAFRSAVKKIQDDLTTNDLKGLSDKFGVSITSGMEKGAQIKELFKVFDGLKGSEFEKRFGEIFKFTPKIDKTELQTQTKQAQASLKALKISTVGSDKQSKSYDELTKEIESALASLPEPQRLAHINILFSKTRYGIHDLALEAAKGKAGFSNLADGLAKTNSASEISEKLNRTTIGQWKTLESGVEAVAISVGSVFLPALASMMEALSPVLLQISAFSQNHETLVKVVGFAAVAILANKAAILGYKSALWLGAGAIDLVTKAQAAWNAVATMNPVGLIIMGIAALALGAYAVIKNWEEVEAFFISLWDSIKPIVNSIVEFFGGEAATTPVLQVPTIGQKVEWESDDFGKFISKKTSQNKQKSAKGDFNFDRTNAQGEHHGKVLRFPESSLNLDTWVQPEKAAHPISRSPADQQMPSPSAANSQNALGQSLGAISTLDMESAFATFGRGSLAGQPKSKGGLDFSEFKIPTPPLPPSQAATDHQRSKPASNYTLHQNIEIKIEGGESAPQQTAKRLKEEVRSGFNSTNFNLFDPVGT